MIGQGEQLTLILLVFAGLTVWGAYVKNRRVGRLMQAIGIAWCAMSAIGIGLLEYKRAVDPVGFEREAQCLDMAELRLGYRPWRSAEVGCDFWNGGDRNYAESACMAEVRRNLGRQPQFPAAHYGC